MTHLTPAKDLLPLESEDALAAGALGFMPRILVLTTLPHRRPESLRFERVNGRHRLRLSAPRRVGLPYGSYARLLLAYLTTEAVRNKSLEIQLGATPNDLARKLSISTTSGPRGTARRLENQLDRLLHMRLEWQTSMGTAPRTSGSACVTVGGASWLRPLRGLVPRPPSWQPRILLRKNLFEEITSAAVPIDLRAIRKLQRSPLAIDLYVWLTYRMSYLRKPTLIPWQSLQNQFGSNYTRPRDFRRKAITQLEKIVRVYPSARLGRADTGLLLYHSPPHVGRTAWGPAHRELSG